MPQATSRISVVIPNFNHALYIGDAIEASLSQSLPPFEIIIIDDASTDDSLSVIKSYQDKHDCIKLLKNEINQGVIASTNQGVEAAQGDFIITRAADDLDYPGFYEKAVETLIEYPAAGLCCGDIAFFGQDINIHQVESLHLSNESTYLSPKSLVNLLGPDPIYGHTVMIRKDLLKAVGGYDADFKWYADWFCTLLLAFKHGICYVPAPFAYARLTHESYSSNNHGNKQVNQKIFKMMLQKLKTEYQSEMSRFLESGVFEFLGFDMRSIIKADQGLLDFKTKVYYKNTGSQSKALENVIRKVLFEKKDAINQIMANKPRFNIVIYGAGRHTRTLISVWQELRLPPIHSIRITGDVSEGQVLSRIPVCSVDSLRDKEVDLMVVSSKSFEKAMVGHCEAHLPTVSRLTFWDQTLTTL